jgi:alkanesulfonate monooxygenase SsuD/methylene tetrahydromethanopterin reductase-like flavin-dependent oxidoreductase (luciferase family)
MLNSILRGTLEPLVQQRDTYVAACRKAGRGEVEIASLLARWGVSRHIYVAPTDAQARAEAREAEMWYQDALRRFLLPDHVERVHPLLQPGFRALAQKMGPITWDQLLAETLAVGSPDTVADKIAEMRDLGVGEVLCWMNFGGLPHERVRRSMELFAREVLPRFR